MTTPINATECNRSVLGTGTVLAGRYVLASAGTEGGTSRVYRARDVLAERFRSSGTDVAIKIFHGAGEPHLALELAHHEAWMGEHFSHRAACRVHGVQQQGDLAFVTMEWIEGESLAKRLERMPAGRVPLGEAIAVAREVAAALAAGHERGVVHSDVKPGNILLGDTGAMKLIDFSTARPAGPANASATRAGEGAGFHGYSPAYASPQTRRDLPASPTDDIYSLGCVVYRMVAGRPPYGDAPPACATHVQSVPPRPQALDRGRWRILRTALSPLSGERPHDVVGFVDALTRGRLRRLLAPRVSPGSGRRRAWQR